MKKRVDYQDPNGDLAEVHERRNAEIRAWADARIAASNAHLTGDHVTTADDWDVLETSPPQDPPGGEWQLTEEPQPVDNPVDDDEPMPGAPEQDGEPEPEAPVEKKPAAKKTAAKKSAAPAKEAPSKEE